jgi:uncharacterized protein YqeY
VLTVDAWKSALGARMRQARRARDAAAVTVLGDALAAIDNAEAQPVAAARAAPTDGPFAGSASGLGAAEVVRRDLAPDEVVAILEREAAQRRDAAAEYARLGRAAEAAALQAQAAFLRAFIAATRGG